MMISMKVEGLRELNKALQELPLQVRGRPLRSATQKAAAVIRNEARAKAPVDTGLLKREIIATRSRRQSGEGRETFSIMVKQLTKKYADTKANRRKGRVGKKFKTEGLAYYWRFIEFGTSKMAARPFLRKAFETKQREAVEVLRKELGDAIQKQARKIRK
jgi:HK97 gp10 family phage protein